ncbi:MAG: S8 family peptidase [Gammaproteobacteria bacterium]
MLSIMSARKSSLWKVLNLGTLLLLAVLGYFFFGSLYPTYAEESFPQTLSKADHHPGSFLVLLKVSAEDQKKMGASQTNSSSAEKMLNANKQSFLTVHERIFNKTHKQVHADLLMTPGIKKVFSYPILLSYVITVEDVNAARPYLEALREKQAAIYHIDRLFPSAPELDVSPAAINIRTNGNPYGMGWWADNTPLQPTTVAIWDGGVDINHPALNNKTRSFYCQPADETNPEQALCAKDLISAHGTSLAGIFASTLEHYPGIASHPTIPSVEFRAPGPIRSFLMAEASSVNGGPLEGLVWLLAGQHPLLDVANYSYGNGDLVETEEGCKSYTGLAQVFDLAITASNATIVKSAGNKGYSTENCTLTVPADAYNILAVADLNPFDWQQCQRGGDRNSFKIFESSSVNAPYTQEPRRLLHVTAPGRYIHSAGLDPQYCKSRCEDNADCKKQCESLGLPTQGDADTYGFWRNATGTSYAAPMVGSVAALLHGSEVKDPMAIKAVIINSADSWTSSDKPSPAAPDEDPENTHCDDANAPYHHATKGTHYDRTYGWGLLNADNTYKQQNNIHIDNISRQDSGEKCYVGTLGEFEKATLVWEKQYGLPLTQLDLTVYYQSQNGSWKKLMQDPSTIDNVKQVSNGSKELGISSKDAEKFMLKISIDEPNGIETFALATAQPFILKNCPK